MKKVFFSLVVAMIAIAGSAFTNAKLVKDPDAVWFIYSGEGSADESTALQPENYTLSPDGLQPCEGSTEFCGVKATNDGNGLPILENTDAETAVTSFFDSVPFDSTIISQEP